MITSGIMKLQTSHGMPTTFHHGTPGFPSTPPGCKDEKQASFQVGDVVEFRGYKNPPVAFRFVLGMGWRFFFPQFPSCWWFRNPKKRVRIFQRYQNVNIVMNRWYISDIFLAVDHNISNHSISIGIIGFHIPQYSHLCRAWTKPSMTHLSVGSCEPRLVNLPPLRVWGFNQRLMKGKPMINKHFIFRPIFLGVGDRYIPWAERAFGISQFPPVAWRLVWVFTRAYLRVTPTVSRSAASIHQPSTTWHPPKASIIPEGREERRQSEVPGTQ